MQKKIILTGIILIMAGSLFAGSKIWHEDFDEAAAMAKKENKPMLLNFSGSDWCVWCKRLNDEVFTKEPFVEYADSSLILISLDFPRFKSQEEALRLRNRKLAERFGIRGFPTVILLDAGGDLIARTGYREGGAGAYVTHLKALIGTGPEE